jgi:hypothetical protein
MVISRKTSTEGLKAYPHLFQCFELHFCSTPIWKLFFLFSFVQRVLRLCWQNMAYIGYCLKYSVYTALYCEASDL